MRVLARAAVRWVRKTKLRGSRAVKGGLPLGPKSGCEQAGSKQQMRERVCGRVHVRAREEGECALGACVLRCNAGTTEERVFRPGLGSKETAEEVPPDVVVFCCEQRFAIVARSYLQTTFGCRGVEGKKGNRARSH